MTEPSEQDKHSQVIDSSHSFVAEELPNLPRAWQLCRVFVDPSWRHRFDALMLFNLECRHLLRDIAEPAVLSARLNFWQREWASANAQNPHHPITVTLGSDRLPDIEPALEGLYQFMVAAAPESTAAFNQRLSGLAKFLAELEAAIDPIERTVTDNEIHIWERVLTAQLIMDLPALCARQRSVLPLDLLARHELNPYAATDQADRVVAVWQSLNRPEQSVATAAFGGLLAAASQRELDRAVRRPETLYDRSGATGGFSDLWSIWRQARAIKRQRARMGG